MDQTERRTTTTELSNQTSGLSLLIMVYNSNLNFNKLVHMPISIELKVSMNYRNSRYIVMHVCILLL